MLNRWGADSQHMLCNAVCATSCGAFVETSWSLWTLKRTRISFESLWYMLYLPLLLCFYCRVSLRVCGVPEVRVAASLYSLACLCHELQWVEQPSVSNDHKHFGVILLLLRYQSHLPPRDDSLLTCLQQHLDCQGMYVLTQAGVGLMHPDERWQALKLLPCLQRLLPASAVPTEGEQTPRRVPTSNQGCCTIPGSLRVSITMGMNLIPITFFLMEPSMPTEGISAFVPQSCTINEANLFCTWSPGSSGHSDMKVKLHYQRTDFS